MFFVSWNFYESGHIVRFWMGHLKNNKWTLFNQIKSKPCTFVMILYISLRLILSKQSTNCSEVRERGWLVNSTVLFIKTAVLFLDIPIPAPLKTAAIIMYVSTHKTTPSSLPETDIRSRFSLLRCPSNCNHMVVLPSIAVVCL